MADDRKVFPTEDVMELVAGKGTPQADAVASFILDRSFTNPASLKASAPFASAWLAQLSRKFSDMEIDTDQTWESIVSQSKNIFGDHISLTRMTGHLKKIADEVLDEIRDMNDSLVTQTKAAADLEKQVKDLKPMEAALNAALAKCGDLENKLKEQKKEVGALRRQIMDFEGKIAISQDDLFQNIKDAIKDGLKNVSIGSAVASTIEASAGAETDTGKEEAGSDDFGFGEPKTDSDGFGF